VAQGGWRTDRQAAQGDLVVTVVDAAGKAVPDAEVRVEMTRHAFKFGTALPAARLLEQSPTARSFAENVLSHFNYATLENDLKWPGFLENPELARKGVEWLSAHNISIRGHNLIWPSFTSDWFMRRRWSRSTRSWRRATHRRRRSICGRPAPTGCCR